MHNRKRLPTSGPGAAAAAAAAAATSAAKAAAYAKLTARVMRVAVGVGGAPAPATEDALKLGAEMLAINPDFATLWNRRRQALLAPRGGDGDDATGNGLTAAAVARELGVSAAGIARNPKSYPAWHHRVWLVTHAREHVDLARELELCGTLLDADERNFHCWNYRRWVAGMAGVGAAEELEFTLGRIRKNFSNYSAWHYRSAVLLRLHGGSSGASGGAIGGGGEVATLPAAVLAAEYDLLRNALFTEPDDQSGWFYLRWLFDRARDALRSAPAGDAPGVSDTVGWLLRTAGEVAELAAAEPRCKCAYRAPGLLPHVVTHSTTQTLHTASTHLQGRCWRWHKLTQRWEGAGRRPPPRWLLGRQAGGRVCRLPRVWRAGRRWAAARRRVHTARLPRWTPCMPPRTATWRPPPRGHDIVH